MACGVFVAYRVVRERPAVTEENYGRMEQGMTAGQVKAILGPETDYLFPLSVDTISGARVNGRAGPLDSGWVDWVYAKDPSLLGPCIFLELRENKLVRVFGGKIDGVECD